MLNYQRVFKYSKAGLVLFGHDKNRVHLDFFGTLAQRKPGGGVAVASDPAPRQGNAPNAPSAASVVKLNTLW